MATSIQKYIAFIKTVEYGSISSILPKRARQVRVPDGGGGAETALPRLRAPLGHVHGVRTRFRVRCGSGRGWGLLGRRRVLLGRRSSARVVQGADRPAQHSAGQSAACARPDYLANAVEKSLLFGLLFAHALGHVSGHGGGKVRTVPHDGRIGENVGHLGEHLLAGLYAGLFGGLGQQALPVVDGLRLQQLIDGELLKKGLRRSGGKPAPQRLGVTSASLDHVFGLVGRRRAPHEICVSHAAHSAGVKLLVDATSSLLGLVFGLPDAGPGNRRSGGADS